MFYKEFKADKNRSHSPEELLSELNTDTLPICDPVPESAVRLILCIKAVSL